MMDRTERAVMELAEPIAESLGFELVRVKRFSPSGRATLQIMAERPDGTMNVDDCAALSRAVSQALDEADPLPGEYVLEVSSPGVDRPLTRPKDFERFEGYEAKIELTEMIEGRKRFRGRLAGFEDGQVLIDLDGEEETALIPFHLVAAAKLVMTDDLLQASLKASEEAARAKDGAQEGDVR